MANDQKIHSSLPPTGKLVYLDNAATSFPKPPAVARAMAAFLETSAVNPGRSGYDQSLAVGQLVDRVRGKLDRFFNNPARDPNRSVFTANATDALNLAIQGLCRPGDHVITSVLDHNSVLRPLHELSSKGIISWDQVPCDDEARIKLGDLARLLRPETRLVVLTAASNVFGRVQPLAEIGRMCRERGVLFLVDAAQAAGIWPLNMEKMKIDLLAFTGHKSLLGPPGIGGLVVGPQVKLPSTRWGGTGVRSAQLEHPQEYPYRLEAGTLNTVGIVGLEAGLGWVLEKGLEPILEQERALAQRLVAAIGATPNIILHGLGPDPTTAFLPGSQTSSDLLPVISLTLKNLDPAKAGMFLDSDHGIAVRTGLQCAPLAHNALGTAPEGTIRLSLGAFNTTDDVDAIAKALMELARD